MRLPGWFSRLQLSSSLKHVAGAAWMMTGRLFALGAIVAFGFAIFVGALSAIDSLFAGRDRWYAEGHLADLEVRVVADDVTNFPSFHGLPGVEDYLARMVYPGSLVASSGQDTVRLLLITQAVGSKLPINTPVLMEGQPLSAGDSEGILIERSLASYNQVGVGDILKIKLGKDILSLTVRGIVRDPEFILAPANPSLFVPSKGSLGVVYANPEVMSERFGFVPANSILFRVAEGVDIEVVRQAVIDRAATRLNVDFSATRSEQFSYQFLEKDLGVFRTMVPVIVLVSALSAAFVTVFLSVQWVMRERQMLGVFMTLGHTPGGLSCSFGVMFLYLALTSVTGGLMGSIFVGQGFMQNFAESIGLPVPELVLTPTYVMFGVVGVLLVFALAGAFATQRVFMLSPRDAMQHAIVTAQAPGAVSNWLGSRLPTIWLRIALRNLLRHGKVSLVTVVAVSLGFGLTSAFFISFSSFIGTSLNSVDKNTWDMTVDFVAPVWQENFDDIVRVEGVADVTPYTKSVALASNNGKHVNLYIGGFDPEKPWYVATIMAGKNLSSKDPRGILLEKGAAQSLGVGVGDLVTLNAQGRKREARIVGLFSGAMPGEARLPIDFHRELADLDARSTGSFIRVKGDTAEVAKRLLSHPDVQQVLSKKQISSEILAASGQVSSILSIGAMISIGIAGLFVFACMGYTVLQRKGDYQSLRLLGYGDGLIGAIIIVEVCLLGAAALVLAVPIGALTAAYLNDKVSEAWFHVDTIINFSDYVKTFMPSFVLLPLVAWPIAWTVLREPLDVYLRSREIS